MNHENNENILASITDINDGFQNGRLMEVFEKYYADDVVMQENAAHDPKRVGKDNNRIAEQFFVDNAVIHGARVDKVIVDGDTSVVLWWMDIQMGEDRMQRDQVAVQTWADGKVVKEVFYYGSPPR
jgi:hypothetical protein